MIETCGHVPGLLPMWRISRRSSLKTAFNVHAFPENMMNLQILKKKSARPHSFKNSRLYDILALPVGRIVGDGRKQGEKQEQNKHDRNGVHFLRRKQLETAVEIEHLMPQIGQQIFQIKFAENGNQQGVNNIKQSKRDKTSEQNT